MKYLLPTILSIALLIAFSTYSGTQAFDPPKSSTGTPTASDASDKEKGEDQDGKDDSAKSSAKNKKSTPLSKSKKMSDPFNKLNAEEAYVILNKGTEARERGYTHSKVVGTYICKRCNAPLYNSTDKFESHCGWPSFDAEIKGSVKRDVDSDGMRIEITCKNCGGHLGHVFEGERYTDKNTRHCVNSISMKLIPKGKELPEVIKAGAVEETTKASDKRDSVKRETSEPPIKKSTK